MKRDELFEKMLQLPQLERDLILARVFGGFQHAEESSTAFTHERFFKIVEEKVKGQE